MRHRSILSIVVLALVAPAAGHAATVSFHQANVDPKTSRHMPWFTVTGDDGADDLRLAWAGDGLDVMDAVRPVVVDATARCTSVDEHRVRCPFDQPADVAVLGRDGDDRIAFAGNQSALVDAGPGQDVIRTGDGGDRVDGGPGDDVLETGAGADELTGGLGHDKQRGGAGDDTFSVSGALDDGETLDGGPGRNAVLVGSSAGPVAVDLAGGALTSASGRVALVGVQDATAAAPGSVISGDERPNRLSVGEDGRAEGRGGDDVLWGRRGAILDGGSGNDRVFPSPGGTVLCGAGADVLGDSYWDGIRPADCEGADTQVGFVGRLARRGATIAVGLDALGSQGDAACGIRVRAVSLDGRPVTAPLRSRRRGLTVIRLPLVARTAPPVVRLVVRYASACPGRGRVWTFTSSSGYRWPAVTLTR